MQWQQKNYFTCHIHYVWMWCLCPCHLTQCNILNYQTQKHKYQISRIAMERIQIYALLRERLSFLQLAIAWSAYNWIRSTKKFLLMNFFPFFSICLLKIPIMMLRSRKSEIRFSEALLTRCSAKGIYWFSFLSGIYFYRQNYVMRRTVRFAVYGNAIDCQNLS